MNQKKYDILIIKLFEDQLSYEESVQLRTWLSQDENLQYFNEFVKINYLINNQHNFDYKSSLQFVQRRIARQRRKKALKKTVRYAAVLVLLAGIGYLLFPKAEEPAPLDTPPVANQPANEIEDIQPGSDKAVLTLGDGSQIQLDDGNVYADEHIRTEGETIVYRAAGNETEKQVEPIYNELTIPRGGQFAIALADGTRVWLNSDSKLRYPVRFIPGRSREVELLYGEAYFEVSPSEENGGDEFAVLTNQMKARVLGTKFNIKAYKDESNLYTTLVSGKVALESGDKKVVLTPKQQAVLMPDADDFEVKTLQSLNELLWREGIFSFNHKPLQEIMKVLSRWYDVDVKFDNKQTGKIAFTGVLDKTQTLEEILNILEATNNIRYEIKERTLIIK